MATIPGGVPVLGFISPPDSADEFAVIWNKYGKGSLRTVEDIAERNAITTQRREEGMVVYVKSDGTYYKLLPDLTTWDVFGGSSIPSGTGGIFDGGSRLSLDSVYDGGSRV